MIEQNKIEEILKSSAQVFKDCSLPNGAIIAANTDLPYYPKRAANYHFVWPRDAAYVCAAAQKTGVKNIQEKFFKWLEDRPERFKKESLLFQNYAPNGLMHWGGFQPDQGGAVLWAIHEYFKDNLHAALEYETLIRRLADGLANDWHETYFFHHTVDLWEEGERHTSSVYQNNHTYSLAACAKGLELANILIKNDHWKEKAKKMKERIDFNFSKKADRFLRNRGDEVADYNVDASLLGLCWPFKIIDADDERMIKTVAKIEEELVIDGGVHRFENDMYDGEGSGQEGGGAWPILNFWLAIYWSIRGEEEKANQYFEWVIKKLEEDNYGSLIPEQIFEDSRQGVYPLAWSHAMFVFTAEKLGYLKQTEKELDNLD